MATTKTLPDNKVVTLPAYTDTADINVISTDLGNITDNINALAGNRAKIQNSSVTSPEFAGLKIASSGSQDVLSFGGGQAAGESGNNGGLFYTHATRVFTFRSKNPSNSTANAGAEDFRLPANTNSTSSNVATYDILTSKDFPFDRTQQQVAAGSSFQFAAKTSVRHAIVGCAGSFFHLCCNNATDSGVYTSGVPEGFTLTKNAATYTLTRDNGSSFNALVLWL